jgi:hypothetical protein
MMENKRYSNNTMVNIICNIQIIILNVKMSCKLIRRDCWNGFKLKQNNSKNGLSDVLEVFATN